MGPFAETLPRLALATPGFDRQAERRLDPDLVPTLLESPATRVVELVGDRVRIDPRADSGMPLLALRPPTPEDGRGDGLAVFLGTDSEGTAYVGVARPAPLGPASGASARPPGTGAHGDEADDLRTLRQVGADLGARDAGLFTTLLALDNWHAAHRFCPRCGAATEPVQAGWLRRCTSEGSEHYPRTDPAVIMSVVDEQGRLLMARGNGWGEGRFSVLAGFVEPGESLAAAVAREVREEVGLEVAAITYLGDQPWPFPTSLMVGFTATALGTQVRLQEAEIVEARWFTREGLLEAVADGSLAVSPQLSISRRLVEHWLGHPIADVR